MTHNNSHDLALPEPLAVAVNELAEWIIRELKAEDQRSAPTAPLYHYTDWAALENIIRTQRLWCFRLDQQSDENEFGFSMSIAKCVILQAADREHNPNPAAEVLLRGLHGMFDRKRLDEIFEFYISSFSGLRDDQQLWTEYGRGGAGFSLGLAHTLFQPDQEQLSTDRTHDRLAGRVIYGPDRTRERHQPGVQRLADIVGRVWHNHSVLVQSNQTAWFNRMNQDFMVWLMWNCLIAKAHAFQHEQETRYIILGEREAFDGKRKCHNGRCYIKTPLLLSAPGSLKEIIVGPDAPEGSEEKIRALLCGSGYQRDIPVVRSNLPRQLNRQLY